MRRPGIKPGPGPWQGPNGACVFVAGIEPGTSRVLGERHNHLDHTTWKWNFWVSIPAPRPFLGRALPIAPIPRTPCDWTRAEHKSGRLQHQGPERKRVAQKKGTKELPPWDFNPRPQDQESRALPTELGGTRVVRLTKFSGLADLVLSTVTPTR